MANSPQARKRAHQAIKRRLHNFSQKSEMRTTIKKALKDISSKELEAAQKSTRAAIKKIDTLAGRNVIHANKAARLKSHLNAKIRAIATTG